MEPERGNERGHTPGLSLWPIGIAVGIACILVGLIVSWWIVGVGAVIAIVLGTVWVLELMRERAPEPEGAIPPEEVPRRAGIGERSPTSRKGFLSAMTLGLGAVIGGIVTLPPLIFAGVPPFLKGEGFRDLDVDLGPLDNFPEGQWMITKFTREPKHLDVGGDVAKRTAYVRYNGLLEGEPSFTIISNRCVHLGCPVQANGPVEGNPKIVGGGQKRVELTQVLPAGFGCPCHGGQYDTEGNRTAGPPVRALDRYAYSIRKGHLFLTDLYSVNKVSGTGLDARIGRYRLAAPGLHLDGWEQIFYPLLPPS